MMYVMTFLFGMMFGGLLGAWTMCAMVSAGEADDREEAWFDER